MINYFLFLMKICVTKSYKIMNVCSLSMDNLLYTVKLSTKWSGLISYECPNQTVKKKLWNKKKKT